VYDTYMKKLCVVEQNGLVNKSNEQKLNAVASLNSVSFYRVSFITAESSCTEYHTLMCRHLSMNPRLWTSSVWPKQAYYDDLLTATRPFFSFSDSIVILN